MMWPAEVVVQLNLAESNGMLSSQLDVPGYKILYVPVLHFSGCPYGERASHPVARLYETVIIGYPFFWPKFWIQAPEMLHLLCQQHNN